MARLCRLQTILGYSFHWYMGYNPTFSPSPQSLSTRGIRWLSQLLLGVLLCLDNQRNTLFYKLWLKNIIPLEKTRPSPFVTSEWVIWMTGLLCFIHFVFKRLLSVVDTAGKVQGYFWFLEWFRSVGSLRT